MKLLLMLLVSFSANATINKLYGEWGSGGGNALVCFIPASQNLNIIEEIVQNNHVVKDEHLPFIESIELFDLYETKKRRGLNTGKPEILEIQSNENYYEYFDRLAMRFDKSVYRLTDIVTDAKEIIPDSQFIFHDNAVEFQNDLGSVTLPDEKCLIITMAAQVNYNSFYEVHIDERLFNHPRHSRQSKATLIMHELIYAYGRKYLDHSDSGSTRNLIRYYISYHPSFTEGLIAKSLNELGFLNKTVSNDLYHQYRASIIMEILAENWIIAIEDFKRTKNEFYQSDEFRNFKEEVSRAYVEDNFGTVESRNSDLRGLQFLTLDGLSRSQNNEKWRNIHQEYIKLVELYWVKLSLKAESNAKWINAMLKYESSITEKEFSNLSYMIKDWLRLDWGAEFVFKAESLIELINDKSKYYQEFYTVILRTEYCEVTDESRKCYGPLKLENIIPK